MDFVFYLAFIAFLDSNIPFRQTSLSLTVLKKKEADLGSMSV